MKEQESEKAFAANVRKVLDAESDNLDAATRSQLNRIRQEALEAGGRPRGYRLRGGMRWLAGAAATAAIAAVVYVNTATAPLEIGSPQPLDEFDIIALEESLDFIEDIEFYAWLAETDDGNV